MLYRSTYNEIKKERSYYLYMVAVLAIIWTGFFIIKMGDSFQPAGGSLDNQTINMVKGIRSEMLNKIFVFITVSGDTVVVIILALIVIGTLYYRNKVLEAVVYALHMLITAGISQGSKYIARRPRPQGDWLVDITKYTHIGQYSFPSGHALIAMSGALLVIYFILSMVKNKILSVISSIFIFAYAVLIGISRIYVGVHYLSDVIAAWAISAVWVVIVLVVYRRYSVKF
ncbi:phosphatase PAP2 family protein [Clostridium ganghwense]|uniref:Phosphatase PAP2 family protein n=1 Tax=Clostridium ganghwense TaxID=312089 RepID=A0ABT4CPJ7_9CLOT|nr:phosphatase PAP2 family protein [Clostridium ganghwense]MCY6370878.1 phosphatase PAP2 family protein [Clostridium ganghwense]